MKKINLSIPNPCHENWAQMTLSEKGRFCNSCQKSVIDFTAMSDRELVKFFKKPVDKVCGRFQPDQLNRDLLLPCKRIPWIKYFFQFVLPAFLISLKVGAQKENLKGKIAVVCNKEIKGDTIKIEQQLPAEATLEVNGRVVDRNGVGVSFASVVIKGTKNGVACDSAGCFKIKSDTSRLVLIASSVGFVSKEFIIYGSSFAEFVLDEVQLSGEVVIVGLIASRPSKPIPLIKRNVDIGFSKFSIYPNPAFLNSSLSINTKRLEKADYILTIINIGGGIIQSRKISVDKKNQVFTFQLEKVVEGSYLIQLSNQKTGKTFTEKLIVR
jgi:hypothetical protein